MSFRFEWIFFGVVATVFLLVFRWKKPFMSNLRGRHIFLTGASSGIGLAIAKQALVDGAYLTLVARSAEKMEKVFKSLLKELELPADRVLVKVTMNFLMIRRPEFFNFEITRTV